MIAGVKVEASSPVLIEGSRAATTDSERRLAIIGVRPGPYTVTFTMQGFAATTREVEVAENLTVPVDGEMRVGAVGETVSIEAVVAR